MKYIFLYIYILFFKIINSFKPFITKYFFSENTCNKARGIIKSLSGLLEHIPYINSKPFVNPVSIIESDEKCGLSSDSDSELESKKCKVKIIIPGYMDHEPKIQAFKFKPKTS